MLVLGRAALALSLVFSLGSVAFLVLGVRQRSRELIRNGYVAVYLFFLAVVVACGSLLAAFLSKDFSFRYVADNSEESLGVFYRIAGFWAGKEGSFLFWLGLLALVTAVIALRDLEIEDRLTAAAVLVLCAVSTFFAVLMVFNDGSDPFARAAPGAVGRGLNPLLLHPAMVLHPPALFAGYVGLAVPFAFAVAALVLGRADRDWVVRSAKWTVGGWALLSLGIGLGAWWAYEELAFGGYWAWDRVENASLIPWLTATALLHSMTLYRRRGVFKHWTLALATLTFWLTIVATWVTRSGALESVHAFEHNVFLDWLLRIVLLAGGVLSAVLIGRRWRRFAAEKEFESLASRDFAFYLTDVVLTLLSLALLFGTAGMPQLARFFTRLDRLFTWLDLQWLVRQFEKTPDYQKVADPLGVIVLAGIAVCPLMSWGRTEGRTFWHNVRIPLAVAALSLPLLVLAGDWRSNIGGLLALVVCFFAGAAVIQFVVVTVRRVGLRRALTGSRTRTAGFVAHFGMVLVVAGLLGSSVYKVQTTPYIDAAPGAEASIGDYTLRFVEFDESPGPQAAVSRFAVFDVFKGGRRIGQARPHFDTYPEDPMGQSAARTSILHFAAEDLFVAPAEFGEGKIGLQLDVFPLITLVWVGSVLLVVGAAVSLWPKPQLAAAPSATDEPLAADDEAA